jgi:hypothetical protein
MFISRTAISYVKLFWNWNIYQIKKYFVILLNDYYSSTIGQQYMFQFKKYYVENCKRWSLKALVYPLLLHVEF